MLERKTAHKITIEWCFLYLKISSNGYLLHSQAQLSITYNYNQPYSQFGCGTTAAHSDHRATLFRSGWWANQSVVSQTIWMAMTLSIFTPPHFHHESPVSLKKKIDRKVNLLQIHWWRNILIDCDFSRCEIRN